MIQHNYRKLIITKYSICLVNCSITHPQSKREVHRRLDWYENHQRECEKVLWWRCLQSGVGREHEERVPDHELPFPK